MYYNCTKTSSQTASPGANYNSQDAPARRGGWSPDSNYNSQNPASPGGGPGRAGSAGQTRGEHSRAGQRAAGSGRRLRSLHRPPRPGAGTGLGPSGRRGERSWTRGREWLQPRGAPAAGEAPGAGPARAVSGLRAPGRAHGGAAGSRGRGAPGLGGEAGAPRRGGRRPGRRAERAWPPRPRGRRLAGRPAAPACAPCGLGGALPCVRAGAASGDQVLGRGPGAAGQSPASVGAPGSGGAAPSPGRHARPGRGGQVSLSGLSGEERGTGFLRQMFTRAARQVLMVTGCAPLGRPLPSVGPSLPLRHGNQSPRPPGPRGHPGGRGGVGAAPGPGCLPAGLLVGKLLLEALL